MSKRVPIAALGVTAALISSLAVNEGWFDKPTIPVKGDVPTIYNGITSDPYTGKPIKLTDDSWTLCQMGDAQECGRRLLYGHLVTKDTGLKKCLKPDVQMTQGEYDILLDFTYQYGVAATCRSSMVRSYNAGNPEAACYGYTKYKYQGKDRYDCSTLINGKPNKRCYGVWTRNLERRDKCLAEVAAAGWLDSPQN